VTQMHALFYTRLALYAILAATPALHPAVAVPYDRTALYTLFGMIPAAMFAAYYGRGEGRVRWWIAGAVFLAFGLFFITGFRPDAWYLVTGAALSYVWTRLVFAQIVRMPLLASLEVFAFGFTYLKILSFARASAELASSSGTLTSVLLALAIVVFCAHACVLYLAAFPGRVGQLKRVFAGGAIAAAVLVAIAFIVPADFVSHNIVLNQLEDEPPMNPTDLSGEPMDDRPGRGGKPEQKPDDSSQNGLPLGDREEKYPSELQNGGRPQGGRPDEPKKEGQGQQGQQGQQGGQGQQQKQNQNQQGGQQGQQGQKPQGGQGQQKGPKLEGIPSDQWNNRNQNGQGEGKQSAVMVIASPVQPVYAAESYNAKFTVDRAFVPDPADDDLNGLVSRRLLQTWRNEQEFQDQFRKPVEIFYFSTIESRVLAFRPMAIEPTIQDKRYKPFNLSYLALSAMSLTGPDEWLAAGNMDSVEREQTALYLDLPKDPRIDRIQLRVKELVKGREWHFQKIEAILKGFKSHQYEMGFDEEMNLDKLEAFLYTNKKGDCTEFSQAAALMGRLAGIPSRAVTGYIASRDLQTPAHRGGAYQIRKRVPALQKYRMEDLYLVTTSHHHAWVQFYIPKIGWVDFETTSYAIPPEPKGDPNQQDVLIPMIEEVPQTAEEKFKFPYRFVARMVLTGAGILFALLYLYRYLRLAFLAIASRKDSPHGLDSLFRLVILRLAHEGNDVRPPFQTHREYASRYPALQNFADRFTELRFRAIASPEERAKEHAVLLKEYRSVRQAARKPGILAFFRRYLSLKGIWI
jgi:transglutaminase-like putative cysteine protease